MSPVNPYDKRDPPWWYFFISLLLLVLAGYSYHYFTDFEATGGTRKINWVVAMAFDFGGKWTVIGFILLMSFFCVYLGIEEIKRCRNEKGPAS